MKRKTILTALVASMALGAGPAFATPWFMSLAGALTIEQPKDDHKGEKKDLGKKKVGDYTVQVTQIGDVKAGEEAVFILVLSGPTTKPKAIRGWVGVESGERSIKSRAEDEEKEWHLHHPVSKPIPAMGKLWVELETASARPKVSFDYK